MPKAFTIGRLSKVTGVKVQTIRYFEQIGMLPAAPRTEGNQRTYDEPTVKRLAFIRHARQLGFPQSAVRDLLNLADHPERPCEDADRIARRQVEQIDSRIAQLVALRDELARMIKQCRGGQISDCRVIEVVSDHALCRAITHAPNERRIDE